MNISQAITNQFKDKVLIADVECYNSITCLTEYLKEAKFKVTQVEILNTGENTIRGIILDGEFAGKECNMFFDVEKEFNFID